MSSEHQSTDLADEPDTDTGLATDSGMSEEDEDLLGFPGTPGFDDRDRFTLNYSSPDPEEHLEDGDGVICIAVPGTELLSADIMFLPAEDLEQVVTRAINAPWACTETDIAFLLSAADDDAQVRNGLRSWVKALGPYDIDLALLRRTGRIQFEISQELSNPYEIFSAATKISEALPASATFSVTLPSAEFSLSLFHDAEDGSYTCIETLDDDDSNVISSGADARSALTAALLPPEPETSEEDEDIDDDADIDY